VVAVVVVVVAQNLRGRKGLQLIENQLYEVGKDDLSAPLKEDELTISSWSIHLNSWRVMLSCVIAIRMKEAPKQW